MHHQQIFIKNFLLYRFQWGIGTTLGKDNVMAFRNLSHNTRYACADIALRHNTTYYSTVIVFNAALNSKSANSTSNGGICHLIVFNVLLKDIHFPNFDEFGLFL